MLLVLVIMYLRSSLALIISTEDRSPSQNITCKHDFLLTTVVLSDCEACLVASRNYAIETTLSLVGSGRSGFSYICLKYNEIEGYHASLVRECRYFPRDTLYGYDDFCIAPPLSYLRGSYRACMCTTNTCNFDYQGCTQQRSSFNIQKSSLFHKTIVQLTKPVNCLPSDDESEQEKSPSNLTPLCAQNDNICKNYLMNNAVLCMISVNQKNNRTTRQAWIPSLYSAYLIKYKTQYCNTYKATLKSVYFSDCKSNNDVCVCTFDGCDKDLTTCQINPGVLIKHYSTVLILISLLVISF